MDYKHAAGRNWATTHRKRHSVNLDGSHVETPILGPSLLEQLHPDHKRAPGRNWEHELRRGRRVRLPTSGQAAESRPYPLREWGGGDHDQPYEYRAPSWRWTFPFSTREYARLLILRSRRSALQPQRQSGHEQDDLVGGGRHGLVG